MGPCRYDLSEYRVSGERFGFDADILRESNCIFRLPISQNRSELLFQITLCGATDDARVLRATVVSEIETNR